MVSYKEKFELKFKTEIHIQKLKERQECDEIYINTI